MLTIGSVWGDDDALLAWGRTLSTALHDRLCSSLLVMLCGPEQALEVGRGQLHSYDLISDL